MTQAESRINGLAALDGPGRHFRIVGNVAKRDPGSLFGIISHVSPKILDVT